MHSETQCSHVSLTTPYGHSNKQFKKPNPNPRKYLYNTTLILSTVTKNDGTCLSQVIRAPSDVFKFNDSSMEILDNLSH